MHSSPSSHRRRSDEDLLVPQRRNIDRILMPSLESLTYGEGGAPQPGTGCRDRTWPRVSWQAIVVFFAVIHVFAENIAPIVASFGLSWQPIAMPVLVVTGDSQGTTALSVGVVVHFQKSLVFASFRIVFVP